MRLFKGRMARHPDDRTGAVNFERIEKMNPTNVQAETERVLARLAAENRREKLLLHACCAPCSSYVLEYLTTAFDITVFYCNPNITDKEEYDLRLAQLIELCDRAPFGKGVRIMDDGYEPDLFWTAAKGLDGEAEGGKRCDRCFALRLSRTADYARENGFPLFATTLTVSPHKNARIINAVGLAQSEQSGVAYLPSDFKKKGGYQRSIVLSKEYGLYRQPYCGCDFSKRTP